MGFSAQNGCHVNSTHTLIQILEEGREGGREGEGWGERGRKDGGSRSRGTCIIMYSHIRTVVKTTPHATDVQYNS